MGMESYYVNITLSKRVDYGNLAIIDEKNEMGKYSICVSYSYYSFFEGLTEIYAFLEKEKKNVIKCETINETEIDLTLGFDMFFIKIYNCNREKINDFFHLMGKLLIESGEDTFKFKRKSRKKIFKK